MGKTQLAEEKSKQWLQCYYGCSSGTSTIWAKTQDGTERLHSQHAFVSTLSFYLTFEALQRQEQKSFVSSSAAGN